MMSKNRQIRREFEKRIFRCPECGGKNILYKYNELPETGRKEFDEIIYNHPDWIIFPVTGYCPRCEIYSTGSVGIVDNEKRDNGRDVTP